MNEMTTEEEFMKYVNQRKLKLLSYFAPFVIFLGVLFIIVSVGNFINNIQNYKTTCFHSKGYCYVERYNLLKSDYVLEQRVPINKLVGLEVKENSSDGREHQVYLETINDKTIADSIPIETDYLSLERGHLKETFTHWLKKKSPDKFEYLQEVSLSVIWTFVVNILFGLLLIFGASIIIKKARNIIKQ